ncbi:hypothetical protein MMPV_003375 [Pyropia vietnamensis]
MALRAVLPRSMPPPAASYTADGTPYVSRHYILPAGVVADVLRAAGLTFHVTDTHAVVRVCPWCTDTRGRRDNEHKLYVAVASGAYFCHRCGAKGGWWALRRRLSGRPLPVRGLGEGEGRGGEKLSLLPPPHGSRSPGAYLRGTGEEDRRTTAAPTVPTAAPTPVPLPAGAASDAAARLSTPAGAGARAALVARGLSVDTAAAFGVGVADYQFLTDGGTWKAAPCFTFPLDVADAGEGSVVRLKARAIDNKASMRLVPRGGAWGLFGLRTVPADATSVVLTEGEFDAMAVYQATGLPAVSAPNGARSLPVDVLPLLERFDRIILWMDADDAGREGAQLFARKLGLRRCRLVSSLPGGVKDANDALRAGVDLAAAIDAAETVPHEGLLTFASLREDVRAELSGTAGVRGLPSVWLPRLDEVLGGHRRGEMSVVTGHTGVGKTTFLAQLSLDYAVQGMPTLWGSFEIANSRLAATLLRQYVALTTRLPLADLSARYDDLADAFESLPMHFLNYHGATDVDAIIDAMDHAVYVHDVGHVLLDNLQFLTSSGGRAGGGGNGGGGGGTRWDTYEAMDRAIHKFRRFATDRNVHVTLVVHPRKENDDEPIALASVFGSAKATQEADNVYALQRGQTDRPAVGNSTSGGGDGIGGGGGAPDGVRRRSCYVQVFKNRYGGTLGKVSLRFDPHGKSYYPIGAARRVVDPSAPPPAVMAVAALPPTVAETTPAAAAVPAALPVTVVTQRSAATMAAATAAAAPVAPGSVAQGAHATAAATAKGRRAKGRHAKRPPPPAGEADTAASRAASTAPAVPRPPTRRLARAWAAAAPDPSCSSASPSPVVPAVALASAADTADSTGAALGGMDAALDGPDAALDGPDAALDGPDAVTSFPTDTASPGPAAVAAAAATTARMPRARVVRPLRERPPPALPAGPTEAEARLGFWVRRW